MLKGLRLLQRVSSFFVKKGRIMEQKSHIKQLNMYLKEFAFCDIDESRYSPQQDLRRIVHSAAFRRLQTKTQVMGSGEGDFHRNRLTHTIEVGSIGRSLIESFKQKYAHNSEITSYIPNHYVMEAICYAHDIGHPPFGHGGEIALHQKMAHYGGFEGNAQTLRQLTRLEKYFPFEGIRPTRRLILGVLKYPADYERFSLENHSYKPPKCYYSEDKDIITKALDIFDKKDREEFCRIGDKGKTLYKSLDASIMELADDIAYGVHDLEDAIARKMLTCSDFVDAFLDKCKQLNIEKFWYKTPEEIATYLFDGNEYHRKEAISVLVKFLNDSASIKAQNIFSSPYLDLQAVLNDEAKQILKFFHHDIGWQKIITKPEIKTLEYKGKKIITELFDALWDNPIDLIGMHYFTAYPNGSQLFEEIQTSPKHWTTPLTEPQQQDFSRYICDFIAQMTDRSAEKYYKRLFEPSFGNSTDEL